MLLSGKKNIYMINFSEKKNPTTFTQFGGGGGVSHVVIYISSPFMEANYFRGHGL